MLSAAPYRSPQCWSCHLCSHPWGQLLQGSWCLWHKDFRGHCGCAHAIRAQSERKPLTLTPIVASWGWVGLFSEGTLGQDVNKVVPPDLPSMPWSQPAGSLSEIQLWVPGIPYKEVSVMKPWLVPSTKEKVCVLNSWVLGQGSCLGEGFCFRWFEVEGFF